MPFGVLRLLPPSPRRIRPSMTIRSSNVNSPATIRSSTVSRSRRLRLRQEADLAEVDAEDRDVHLGHGPGRAQERAVAAEDDEGVGRRQLAQERVQVAGRATATPRCRACGTSRTRAPQARPWAPASGCRRSRCGRSSWGGRPPSTSAMRSPMSAQPGPGARWTRNSRLPSGPEDRRGDDRARAETAFRGRRDDALEDLAVDGRDRGPRRGPSGPCRPRTAA